MSKFEEYKSQRSYDIPETMQAVVAAGRGFENLSVVQIPVPRPSPDQLLARVDAAGVCTSIIKLIAQGPDHTYINGWDMSKWPIILGDEGAVTIVEVGDNLVDQYSPGERFAIQPAVGVSPILHRERYNNNAESMNKCAVGYSLPGHLAQYILIQQEVLQGGCLLPLPNDDLPYFGVSMAEPISCIFSAQERNYHIVKDGPNSPREPVMGLLPGGIAVVIGAGAMGRIHAELALRFRPSVLIVSDLQQERLDKTVRAISQSAQEKKVHLECVTADKLGGLLDEVSGGKGADDIILAIGINPVWKL